MPSQKSFFIWNNGTKPAEQAGEENMKCMKHLLKYPLSNSTRLISSYSKFHALRVADALQSNGIGADYFFWNDFGIFTTRYSLRFHSLTSGLLYTPIQFIICFQVRSESYAACDVQRK